MDRALQEYRLALEDVYLERAEDPVGPSGTQWLASGWMHPGDGFEVQPLQMFFWGFWLDGSTTLLQWIDKTCL